MSKARTPFCLGPGNIPKPSSAYSSPPNRSRSPPRNMPTSRPIPTPMRGALLECFRATTRLVRPELRSQLTLVGGAASIAHSSVLYTEDVDVAGPAEVLTDIGQAVMDGAPNFSFESNGKISFDAPQGFRISIDIIQIGEGCIERIHSAEPLFEGSVASKLDLLRLRAVTVVDRGSDGECQDFRWLLSEVARAGQVLPGLDDEELEYVSKAGGCLGLLDRLVLGAILGAENAPAACRLFSSLIDIPINIPYP
ncbi:hypothetical protein FQN52_002323 [Onygenales sp. PD_12]|nr:hypothetical protein FQN52_002323 [Onygenales sp. PD_12]